MGPVVPHSPQRQVTEAWSEHRRRPWPVARKHAARSSAHDAGADRRHPLVERKGCRTGRSLRWAVQDHPQRWSRPAPEIARYRRSYLGGGRGAAAVEGSHHHGTPQKEGSDKVRQLQGHLADSARRQDTAEDSRLPPQRLLWARGDPAGGTEWFPTEPFYHRCNVCDSSVTGAGAEETNSAACMLYRPHQSVRPRWSNPPLDGTRPFWRATEYDLGHSSIPRWYASMRAARRQGVLDVVCCGTRSSSRVRARAPPVQHLLRGGHKRRPHAFQGGRRHHGRFGTPEEEKGGGGAGGSNCRRVSPGDAALGHALSWRCRGRLEITRAAEEDDVYDRGRVRGIWPHRIGGQDWDHVFTREGDAGVRRHIQRKSQRARCTTRRTSLYTSGETSTTTPTCPSRSTGTHATHGAAFGSTPSNCTTDRALPSSSKSGC